MRRELWLYDIASAYPFAMLHLPSMRDGKWIAHKLCPVFDLEELARIASTGQHALDVRHQMENFPQPALMEKSSLSILFRIGQSVEIFSFRVPVMRGSCVTSCLPVSIG